MNELPKLDTKTTKESIIKFIQDKVSEANAKGLVVGLSGGIDSTLTAYLATDDTPHVLYDKAPLNKKT